MILNVKLWICFAIFWCFRRQKTKSFAVFLCDAGATQCQPILRRLLLFGIKMFIHSIFWIVLRCICFIIDSARVIIIIGNSLNLHKLLYNSTVFNSGEFWAFLIFFTKRSVVVLIWGGTYDADSSISSLCINAFMNWDIIGIVLGFL